MLYAIFFADTSNYLQNQSADFQIRRADVSTICKKYLLSAFLCACEFKTFERASENRKNNTAKEE